MGKNPNAVALGRLGGSVSSEKKQKAVKENGKLGGRPRKIKEDALSVRRNKPTSNE